MALSEDGNTMEDGAATDPLDTPLQDLELPARVWSFIERRGLVTLRDVVALDPHTLQTEKNFGRKSLTDLRTALEQVCGTSWEQARATGIAAPTSARVPRRAGAAGDWESLGRGLDAGVGQYRLDAVRGLPTRMRSFAAERGIERVGELLALPFEALASARNMGRLTLRESQEALARFVDAAATPAMQVVRTLDDHPSLLHLWRAATASLEAVPRLVLQQRSGLVEAGATLQSVGEMLGFSRERARQIESHAAVAIAKDGWWMADLEARLQGHLSEGVVALPRLAVDDPWLASLHEQPDVFDFINARFLGGRFHRVRLGDEDCLARVPQVEFDRAWRAVDEGLAAWSWPAPWVSVIAYIEGHASSLGRAAVAWIVGRVNPLLTFDDEGGMVLSYGGTREREILAWLRAQGAPVPVRALAERYGRGRWPEEVVYVERGVVTVAEHLEGFDAWSPRVVARCVEHMRAQGADRQWASAELVAALRFDEPLPSWFGPWPLGAMLMRSPAVRYLGRGIAVLPEVEGERLHLRALVLDVLTREGAPVHQAELERQVGARRGLGPFGLTMVLQKPPFLETGPGLFGVLERDLPGGRAAATRAVTHLVEGLAQRGCGVSLREALDRLASHAEVFDRWTPESLRSVCRHDARLLTSIGGAIGLAEWGDVRLPTRREILRQALAEGKGRARVDDLRARVLALYGDSPSRNSLAWMAWHEGAGLEGDWIVLRAEGPIESDMPALLPGLDPLLQRRVAQLAGMVDAQDDLAEAVDAHVRRFFFDAVTSEGTDLHAALTAQRYCHDILRRTANVPEPVRQLGHAAVRYFLLDEDAAWDFVHRGLQDDLAVLTAALRLLDEGSQEECPP